MPANIEGYALIGNCEGSALVGRDGSIDWLALPRFDSQASFAALLGTEENGRWLIAPAVPVLKVTRAYRPGTLVLETRFETAEGTVVLTDAMGRRESRCDLVRLVHARVRHGADARRGRAAPRLRRGGAVGQPPRGRARRRRGRAGPLRARHARRAARREPPHGGRFRRPRGRRGALRDDVVAFFPARAAGSGCGTPHRPRDARLAGLDQAAPHGVRGRVPRRGAALAADPEGADPLPDGGHRGGPDDVLARATRRPAQLGLPLLLAARRHADALRAADLGLSGGGRRLARLADPRHRGLARPDADHVRHRGRAAPRRVRTALARRLRGLDARAGRQRRGGPAPARRLRRGARRHVPGAMPRPRAGRQRLAPGARARVSLWRRSGASPTRASGRCGAAASTSPPRR